MVKAEEILSTKTMRILNIVAVTLFAISWLVRFYYITERDVINEETVTSTDGKEDEIVYVETTE